MRHLLLAAALVAGTAIAAPAAATTTVATSGTGIRALQVAYYTPGQTFVPTEGLLNSFGFQFQTFNFGQPNSAVTLQIRAGAGLTGQIVGSVAAILPTFPNDRSSNWYDFTLPGLQLTAGQTYTAMLSSGSSLLGVVYGPDINIFTGAVLGTDGYLPGRLVAGQSLDTLCSSATSICDLNFRFTTSAAAAVPEPAGWALMLAGFGTLGAALRRRRRVPVAG